MHFVKFSARSKALAPAVVYKFIRPPVPTGDCCSLMTRTVAGFTVAFRGQCFSDCHTSLKPLMPEEYKTEVQFLRLLEQERKLNENIIVHSKEEQVRAHALPVSLRATSKDRKTILTYLWPQQKDLGVHPHRVGEQQL